MTNEDKLLAAILRQDFSSFIDKVFHTINPGADYDTNWHIDLIADYLEAIRNGEIKRLIINIPPRALKSVCVSVAWPAWLLGQDPGKRIMAASYSSILSIKHSLDCRFVLSSDWYRKTFPSTILSKKHNQKSKFLTTANGFRFATSVGGSATGEGGDILVIDDPHNPTQINSQKARDKVIEWFEQTFVTRLNNKNTGAIVLVMQRLHEDDLAAHLIKSGGWHLLKIPAISNHDQHYQIGKNNYHYPQGQLLNQSRDQFEFLHNLEHEIGSRNFAAQFLQEPLPTDLNMLNHDEIRLFDTNPDFEYFIISWDTAIKTSEKSDYSVGTCWGIAENKYYMVDMIRQKMSYPDLKKAIEAQIKQYDPKYILIEDKASGQSLIQDLRINGQQNIKAIKPKNDKLTRFASVVPIFQAGQVLITKKTHINREMIKELTSFPNCKHDDIIDSISQFLNFTKELRQQRKINIRRL